MKIKQLVKTLSKLDKDSDINFVIRGEDIDDDIWINKIQAVHEYFEEEGNWAVIDITKEEK